MWVVILKTDDTAVAAVYGPFPAEDAAKRFADFVTAEVDPAFVLPLWSPVTELLNWRDSETAGGA